MEQVTAADQAALVEESQRFVGDMSAPGTLERVRWMMDNGGQQDGELERDLGAALGRYPG